MWIYASTHICIVDSSAFDATRNTHSPPSIDKKSGGNNVKIILATADIHQPLEMQQMK
jgi:hypothetical protein